MIDVVIRDEDRVIGKLTEKVAVRGVVLGVEFTRPDGTLGTPPTDTVMAEFMKRGFDVQSVTLGIDGCYLIEVLS